MSGTADPRPDEFPRPAALRWLQRQFGRQLPASSLALFRIVWGALMIYEGTRKLTKVSGIFSPEIFHFTYPLFPGVAPFPEIWMMTVEAWLLIAAAIAMTLGVGFRWATLLFTLLYTHFFLIDALYYNNHFYLTILTNLLLAFTRADRMWSLRALRNPAQKRATVPLWNLAILRGQVVVVYFFGGLAKLNLDWFQGEPVRFWLQHHTPVMFPLSYLIQQEWFVSVICSSGVAIDLTAGFLLLHRKTFWLIAPVLIGFHATNSQLFKIGIFPFLGVGMLVLFFDPTWPQMLWDRLRARLGRARAPVAAAPAVHAAPAGLGTTLAILAYFGFQILWPLRIHIYGDNPGWTEVGHSFSWRMMLRHKDGYAKFLFDPPEAERLLETTDQLPRASKEHILKMVKDPGYILQYVHAIDATFEKLGQRDVEIRVLAVASMDGRPYQLLIDPSVDLTRASLGWFEVPDWIVPLEKHRRPGVYPATAEERRRWIQAAVDEYGREYGLPEAALRVPLQPLPEAGEDAY